MVRNAVSKVMWVGRATVFLVGLAVILALTLGVASTALGKNGQSVILGKGNNVATKVTGIIGKVASGSALVVKNPKGGSALGLSVGNPTADPASKTVAPMRVDSQARIDNLNADKLDGTSSEGFANSVHNHSGSNITSGTVAEARIDPAIARDSEVILGRGLAQQRARAYSPGENLFFWNMTDPALSVSYNCPGDLASNGFIGIKNTSTTETVNAFSDNGEGNPFYNQLDPNEFWSQGAAAAGEHITFQVQGTYVATIEVFSVHRTSDNKCHVQAQALVTKP